MNSGLRRDVELVILKAMAPEPAERYGTARALVTDVRTDDRGRGDSTSGERGVRDEKLREAAAVSGLAEVSTV